MITSVDKAIVALILAVIYLLNYFFGWKISVDAQLVTTIVTAVLMPILVWAIPNKPH